MTPGGAGGLVVCGTGSDSGKSTVVAGLCRLLARQGLRVAPFKAQNMANNSAVTASGHEIGRAQAAQAAAAGVPPEVAMNPVLLKPTDHRSSQVVVMGRPWATLDAAAYQAAKAALWPVVAEQVSSLRARFDVVICEGAGSPAEINLLDSDITNLRIAEHTGFPALLVGDIDRGGVFASLFGTVAILPPHLAGCIRAFLVNKFRGDPDLLTPGLADLERRTGVPTIGVLPWMDSPVIDSEDSLALSRLAGRPQPPVGALDVAAVRLPRISNFTDLDALALEPGVRLRLVDRPADLGRPDLVILPGSKSTVADLGWLRASGLADAIISQSRRPGCTVLGVCGGYQMLGRSVEDGIESGGPLVVAGLGLLDGSTVFHARKVTRLVEGTALSRRVNGYEIHHGRTSPARPWITLDGAAEGDRSEGDVSADGGVLGTSVHGLFENDGFRRAFLHQIAERAGVGWAPGAPVSFAAARHAQYDRLADAIEAHVDMHTIHTLIKAARP